MVCSRKKDCYFSFELSIQKLTSRMHEMTCIANGCQWWSICDVDRSGWDQTLESLLAWVSLDSYAKPIKCFGWYRINPNLSAETNTILQLSTNGKGGCFFVCSCLVGIAYVTGNPLNTNFFLSFSMRYQFMFYRKIQTKLNFYSLIIMPLNKNRE